MNVENSLIKWNLNQIARIAKKSSYIDYKKYSNNVDLLLRISQRCVLSPLKGNRFIRKDSYELPQSNAIQSASYSIKVLFVKAFNKNSKIFPHLHRIYKSFPVSWYHLVIICLQYAPPIHLYSIIQYRYKSHNNINGLTNCLSRFF